jgi:hypothetical protein
MSTSLRTAGSPRLLRAGVAAVSLAALTGAASGQCTITCGTATPEIGPCVTPPKFEPPPFDVNGGCEFALDAFQNITCGQSICGQVWISQTAFLPTRDVDWYRLNLTQPTRVTWSVDAEFPAELAIIMDPEDPCGGDLVSIPATQTIAGCNTKLEACLDAGVHYLTVAHQFAKDGQKEFFLDCAAAANDYKATATCVALSPVCDPPLCPPGSIFLTHSSSQVISPMTSTACFDGIFTYVQSFGRAFNLAQGATAGQPFQIACVEAAIERNSGADVTAQLRIYRDTNGGGPTGTGTDLVLLGSKSVVIPNGFDLDFVTATFDPPLLPPVNSTIFFELFIPASLTGGVWPGSNTAAQTGPTYFKAATCLFPNWINMASIPPATCPTCAAQHNVMNIRGSIVGQCPEDFDSSGVVNGFDLAILLGQWTGAATYAPCPPFKPQDLNSDCKVNGLDLAMLLAAWGPC